MTAAVVGAMVVTLAWAVPAAQAAIGGGAYGLSGHANVIAAPLSIGAVPSVTLPADGGGPYVDALLSANVAGLAPVEAATASTRGNTGIGSVTSSASVLKAGVAGLVTVATARSSCSAGTAGASGSAAVADLVVAGIAIDTVDAGPNTRISLPIGSVTLNEQLSTRPGDLTVNAIHVSIDATLVDADIVIGQSRCSVTSSTRARGQAVRRARKARR